MFKLFDRVRINMDSNFLNNEDRQLLDESCTGTITCVNSYNGSYEYEVKWDKPCKRTPAYFTKKCLILITNQINYPVF